MVIIWSKLQIEQNLKTLTQITIVHLIFKLKILILEDFHNSEEQCFPWTYIQEILRDIRQQSVKLRDLLWLCAQEQPLEVFKSPCVVR